MTEHTALGGSSAHRWMKCPGSVRMQKDIPDETSPHAAEGTAAHALAEYCLLKNVDAESCMGHTLTGVASTGFDPTYPTFEVTQEMADAVQVYLDAVRGLLADRVADVYVEAKVNLAPLDPPAPMFGITDVAVWCRDERALDLVDYKHGRGVVVEVEGNVQALYYALGTCVELRIKPNTIRMWIVQPRAAHPDGPVRQWTITWAELVEFKTALFEAAEATTQADAPLTAGDHCRWCRAKAICPAQHQNAVVVAQHEFPTMTEEALPTPDRLTEEEILEVLDKASMVEDWLASIREHVKARLEAGEEVDGWKLVAKRAMRRWADPEQAEKFLRRKVKVAGTYKKTLVSPAQAEKALRAIGEEIPDGLVNKVSSGHNLAPESNPRPAIVPAEAAQAEFETE